MQQFLNLNRNKLAFVFKTISLTFLIICLAIVIIAHINNIKVKNDFVIFALLLIVTLPCFLIFISYLAWHYKQWAKQKAFSKSPFDKLPELGFSPSLLNEKSKWLYTEEIKVANVGGFNMFTDILYDKAHIIEFRVIPAWRQMDNDDYKKIKKTFKSHNIEYNIGSIVKSYNTRKLSAFTIHDLKNELEEFTEILRRNGIEPLAQNNWP